ncbi:DNA replication protein [Yersinia pseudotuberculosis]|uniref:DNA replication protein n=2 Tax=Yersinia TaxID=629 RepID=A0ABM7ACU7_YERPU|nr:replication protein P [Yersinia pseudotuberculosis]AYW90241.1 DNA replication protein [Yersinia pseudotuberculosis]AYW92815.1 DNA replication protein [Yersinia pseudotuberculosis]AYX13041.1 DNA replication protein [Yersinia pseudotuberculosis]AYX15448.1 DNA replication protein [Yersinia pseudotuberculosis]MBO1609357.1 DNA replication protein [Yersinia pseudotuberculosis]
MRNVVTAIQNRDGQSLQQMYAADKPKQQVPEQAAQIFNELFRQLKAAFPALMTSIKDQSDLNELRRQWVLAFIENGITSIDQVNAGMKIARQQATPFLPSPGQFIAWCKQGATRAAGLPDADELYDMVMDYAKRRDMFSSAEAFPWPSNPTYWMVTKLYSQQRVQGLSEQDLRKRCGKELADMSKRIEAGEPIPAPVVQIPKLHIPVSNEKALDHIAELRAKLNMTRKS